MSSPNHGPKSSNTPLTLSSNGAAFRRGDLTISDPFSFNQTQGFVGQPGSAPANMYSFPSSTTQPDASWPRKSTPPRFHGRNPSIGDGQVTDLSRASAGPSILPSSMSTAPSKTSLNQKKNSGFRATLKRVFGSKRRRSTLSDAQPDLFISDPGNLTSILEKQTDRRVARVASQSATSVTRASALGSHAPYSPLNNLPRSPSERNRLISPRRRRRNTLPSLVLTEPEAQLLARPVAELPAKAYRKIDSTENYLKRRSRSADALNDMTAIVADADVSHRAREDDIAYWRTSIIENPAPEFKCYSQHEENQHLEPVGLGRDQTNAMPAQPFDFGLGRPGSEPVTLEQRINMLEVKMFDFEYALAKLQGNDIPKPVIYNKPPKRRSIHELFPESGTKSTVSSSYSHEKSYLSSPAASPLASTENDDDFRPNRSSKATTIRPLASQRRSPRRSTAQSPSPTRISPDQFDRLMDLFKQERESRQQLESQLLAMQKEMAALRTPVYAEIRSLPYPTPSPESFHDNPAVPRTLHRTTAFQLEKAPHETSRFSMSEVGSDTEDGSQDVYETPREDRYTFESTRASPLVGAL